MASGVDFLESKPKSEEGILSERKINMEMEKEMEKQDHCWN